MLSVFIAFSEQMKVILPQRSLHFDGAFELPSIDEAAEIFSAGLGKSRLKTDDYFRSDVVDVAVFIDLGPDPNGLDLHIFRPLLIKN